MHFSRILIRVMSMLATLVAASFIAFAILEFAPGDVSDRLISDSATAEQAAALRAELGLDQSFMRRYLGYMQSLVMEGDLGRSLISKRPVSGMVFQALGHTLKLAVSAVSLASLLGIAVGSLAARYAGKWTDMIISSLSILGISLPVYIVALFLVQYLAVRNQWLPLFGAGSWQHLVMPAVSLALPFSAVVARLTRSSVINASRQPHVLTAHAKGVQPLKIWYRHILRNAFAPILSIIGLHFGHLLGGTFIIETIFSYPGLGRMTVQAVFDQDFPVVLAAVLCAALIFQLINLVTDILQGYLDPRVAHKAV